MSKVDELIAFIMSLNEEQEKKLLAHLDMLELIRSAKECA